MEYWARRNTKIASRQVFAVPRRYSSVLAGGGKRQPPALPRELGAAAGTTALPPARRDRGTLQTVARAKRSCWWSLAAPQPRVPLSANGSVTCTKRGRADAACSSPSSRKAVRRAVGHTACCSPYPDTAPIRFSKPSRGCTCTKNRKVRADASAGIRHVFVSCRRPDEPAQGNKEADRLVRLREQARTALRANGAPRTASCPPLSRRAVTARTRRRARLAEPVASTKYLPGISICSPRTMATIPNRDVFDSVAHLRRRAQSVMAARWRMMSPSTR